MVEWEEEIRDLQLQVGLHPEGLRRKCHELWVWEGFSHPFTF